MNRSAVKYRRAKEILRRSLRSLAINPARIQERLGRAATHLSALHENDRVVLPKELQKQLIEFEQAVTAIEGPAGSIPTTTAQMSDDRAVELASQLLEMFYKVEAL